MHNYLVSLLFPNTKPIEISPQNLEIIEEQKTVNKKNSWEIIYELPFEPLSIWKTLFLKIRFICVGGEEKLKMIEEIYWMKGFYFCFNYLNEIKNKTQLENNSTEVSLEMVSPKDEENKSKQKMKIKIETNENPDKLFQSIHFCVKNFIRKNFFNHIFKEITVSCIRNSVSQNENFLIKDKNLQSSSLSLHKDVNTASCAFCGLFVHLNQDIVECENCSSNNFLIESKYALINVK